MSGRHRRPEADRLADVDLARRLTPGPVVRMAGVLDGSAAGTTVVARRDRAAERAARRAAERRRGLMVLGAVVGVLVLGLGVVGTVVMLRGDDGTGTEATRPAEQETLLVQVTGEDGVASASALVGVTPGEDTASVVLIPSGLLVDVAGTGNIPFGETVTLPEGSAPSQALTDLVGVRVDDGWVLTTRGLSSIVESVGGVDAAVDVDVVTADADGEETVLVRAGTQELGGRAAAAYATYQDEGEPEQARLARFDDVLSGLLTALPEDRAAVVAALRKAGGDSRSTLEVAGIAGRLLELKAAADAEALVSDVLPVNEIDTGAVVPTYGIEPGQVAAMMRSRFPGALQEDAGGDVVRVLVENGVGTPGLVEQARAELVAAGFRFVNGGNAGSFGPEPSVVLVPDGTERNVRRGARVAAALGLPESAVTPSDRGQTVADVIVVLGSDFGP